MTTKVGGDAGMKVARMAQISCVGGSGFKFTYQ